MLVLSATADAVEVLARPERCQVVFSTSIIPY
jgi:hypothetical protein